MISIRAYYVQLGGHVHVRIFSSPTPFQTGGRNGVLIFSATEWPHAKRALELIATVLPDGAQVETAETQGRRP